MLCEEGRKEVTNRYGADIAAVDRPELAQSSRGAVERAMLSTDVTKLRDVERLELCGLETRQYGALWKSFCD